MIYILARFTVKRPALKKCKQVIAKFVRAVRREKGTAFYQSFQLPDKTSFIHLMAFRNKQTEMFHRKTPHVKKFVGILYPNCSKKPVFTTLTLVR